MMWPSVANSTYKSFLFFSLSTVHRDLHSFPTRRSSDLHAELFALADVIAGEVQRRGHHAETDRKSTRLNSSHRCISYAVFCLKKKKRNLLSIPNHGRSF